VPATNLFPDDFCRDKNDVTPDAKAQTQPAQQLTTTNSVAKNNIATKRHNDKKKNKPPATGQPSNRPTSI
jgi:hypothetical protein